MNLEKTNHYIALVANIGVLIGIFLLIIELNQNTEMMRSEMAQNRTNTAMQFQQSLYSSDYLPNILNKVDNEKPLTEEELRRYTSYFHAFNRNQDNTLWQYENGFLAESTPRSIRAAVSDVIGNNEFTLNIWDQRKRAYSDEYITLVENEIADLRNK